MRDWKPAFLPAGQSFRNRPLQRITALQSRFARFRREEDGAIAFLSLCVFLVMFSIAGLGIDLMRHEITRAKMQVAMDNALASVANLQETRDPALVIADYLAKQELNGAIDHIEATDNTGKLTMRTISAAAENDIGTIFLRVAGVDRLGMRVEAGAVEAQANTELSLVLDVSRSMQSGNRIDYLRPAAKSFVSTLLSGEAATTTSINLIPYAGQTNPGPVMFDLLGGVRYGTTGDNLFPSGSETLRTVLYYQKYASYYAGDDDDYTAPPVYDHAVLTDGYPGSDVTGLDKDDLDSYVFFLDAYHRRHDTNLSDSSTLVGVSFVDAMGSSAVYDMNGAAMQIDPVKDAALAHALVDFKAFHAEVIGQVSSCLELNSADFQNTSLPTAGTYSQTPHFEYGMDGLQVDKWGWCPEDATPIQYAQNSYATLSNAIDGLRLHEGDGTQYAMRYGLALLDPTSSDEFAKLADAGLVPSEFAAGPKAWTNADVGKYIVLVSDGGIDDQARPTHPYAPVNTTTALSLQASSETTLQTTGSENRQNFYASCELAKQNGVEVFTIAFGADAAAQTEMRTCASSSYHYFEATGSDISEVFGTISRRVTQLRLTN